MAAAKENGIATTAESGKADKVVPPDDEDAVAAAAVRAVGVNRQLT